MPTVLTTPVARNAVSATVDFWALDLNRDPTTLAVQPDQTNFSVTVKLRYSDGSVSQKIVAPFPYNELPVGAQNTLKAFHAQIVSFMRSQGILPAGTDTPDI